jgi:hypothetical protein
MVFATFVEELLISGAIGASAGAAMEIPPALAAGLLQPGGHDRQQDGVERILVGYHRHDAGLPGLGQQLGSLRVIRTTRSGLGRGRGRQ